MSDRNKPVVKLTKSGVFVVASGKRRKVAETIRLRGLGKRIENGHSAVKVQFKNDHGEIRNEFFDKSWLLADKRRLIKSRLADLGYDWPENKSLSDRILRKLATTDPRSRFLLVGAPGWYGTTFVMPDATFGGGDTAVYIDPDTSAHIGPFALGPGSLEGWKETVAKPSGKSSPLRVFIGAGFSALLLRPLGYVSFGINLFSDTSDGKTTCLAVGASVAGFLSAGGMPGWADTTAAIEQQAWGYRDCAMPLDETGDGEQTMSLEKKAKMLAYLLSRNRPRRLSRAYERDHSMFDREFRIILLSSSEQALGDVAENAGTARLGGEEVRLMDLPATAPGSSGIFDGRVVASAGLNIQDTTKELVDKLKVNARQHQGHPLRAFLEKYTDDNKAVQKAREYKAKFESDAKVHCTHNAHYRHRSNFGIILAGTFLAIDYEILPWNKKNTFEAIEKCMLASMERMKLGSTQVTTSYSRMNGPQHVLGVLREKLTAATLRPVVLKKKVSDDERAARRAADGFVIDGDIYVKHGRLTEWFDHSHDRAALREAKIFKTKRHDTPTIEKKIAGIAGKPRYYVIDESRLERAIKGLNPSD